MSGGALAQLVSRGEQDKHISGSPNTTYFNTKFKRHTNFSLFTKQMTVQMEPKAGGMSSVKINKLGDLLAYTNLVTKLNGEVQLIDNWTDVIDKAELYIGGRLIDSQDSEFCEVFRKVFNALELQLEPQSIPACVLIIADYQYKSAFAMDSEINFVACLTEIMGECKFK